MTRLGTADAASEPQHTCNLPPTCLLIPTVYATLEQLDRHHLLYHSFICQATPLPTSTISPFESLHDHGDPHDQPAICGRVFPDEFMLQCHLVENHDTLSLLRQERGEAIVRTSLRYNVVLARSLPAFAN